MNIFSVKENVEHAPATGSVRQQAANAQGVRYQQGEADMRDSAPPQEATHRGGWNDIPFPLPPPANIKAMGVGGGGSNAINRMIACGLSGMDFIAVNTDAQDLFVKSNAEYRLQIGGKLTGGRGAGGDPQKGADAVKEDQDRIREILGGCTDMLFIAVGLGGGTGTGAAPEIARIAKEMGILTVVVATLPFLSEGTARMNFALAGAEKLRAVVDTLVIIPNQQVLKIADRKTSVIEAYRMADEVLRQGVQGISDLILKTGLINTDFADVRATLEGQGDALLGIGQATGDDRAEKAAKAAIDNPLLEDTSIDGATRILINISGGEDISIVEIDEIMRLVKAKADPDVNIIHGLFVDPEAAGSVKVTVIATGFHTARGAASARAEPEPRGGATREDIISVDKFNEMRGLRGQEKGARGGDNYFGVVRSRNGFVEEDMEMPAYVRRQPEGGFDRGERSSSGGREA